MKGEENFLARIFKSLVVSHLPGAEAAETFRRVRRSFILTRYCAFYGLN
jgi:hypothetical protein